MLGSFLNVSGNEKRRVANSSLMRLSYFFHLPPVTRHPPPVEKCSRTTHTIHMQISGRVFCINAAVKLPAVCIAAEMCPRHHSNALEKEQPHSKQISSNSPIHSLASNVSMSAAKASFPSDFFNSCNIQGNVQVYFSLHYWSDSKDWLHFAVFFAHL